MISSISFSDEENLTSNEFNMYMNDSMDFITVDVNGLDTVMLNKEDIKNIHILLEDFLEKQ